MDILKGKLIERIKRTSIIESFRFMMNNKLEFMPGQYLQLIFDEDNMANKDLNKFLSFSSSPTREYIEVTKRLSSSEFSHRLSNLKNGHEVALKAPLGDHTFKNDYKKIGFLIGGIGITPAISIIEYIVDKKLDTDVVLLYSNKTEEDIAFREELDSWRSANSNIKVFYTITGCEPVDKNCIFGQIDNDLFIKKFEILEKRIFFIFGPPKMVEAMRGLCLGVGCHKDNIKTESFIGY